MKIDRLYALTLYLLNHGKTSSADLARKFEVSIRTIQRDIDSLCISGVPIIAEMGKNGGYYIADWFVMKAQMVSDDDYSYILTGLKGYSTAIDNANINLTVEKIASLTRKTNESVILDFSVLREIDDQLLHKIKEAISKKKSIRMYYTNAENVFRRHVVEPIAVIYKWYAWYLLGYSIEKDDYRLYKMVRISELEILDLEFTKKHNDTNSILQEINRNSN